MYIFSLKIFQDETRKLTKGEKTESNKTECKDKDNKFLIYVFGGGQNQHRVMRLFNTVTI